MKHSISAKIAISFCLLMVVMMVAQVVFNVYFSKQYFLVKNIEQLETLYQEIKEGYSDDESTLYDLTEYADSISGFTIQIFSNDELIFSTRNNVPFIQLGESEISSVSLESYAFNPSAQMAGQDGEEGSLLTIHGKFIYDGEYRYVRISKPVESIEESISVFTQSNMMISFVVFLVGVVVVLLMARSISRPIKQIEKVSTNLAKCNFSYRANEAVSTKELANLSSSMNVMADNLRTSMQNLETANAQLKKEVDYQKNIERNRKQFIAGVSHEMKTPLALLQIYSENLADDVEGIDKEEYCRIIIDETKRLNSIVEDMLAISAIEHGFARSDKETYSLSQSCRAVVNSMMPLFDNLEVTLEIKESLYIYGDEKQLSEAMRNYLNNALSHARSHVGVFLSCEKGKITFAVSNDGCPIDEVDIAHVWDSFYKSDTSRTRTSTAHAGLGLNIVKVIVENHEGTYKVENKPDGVVFSFTLDRVSS